MRYVKLISVIVVMLQEKVRKITVSDEDRRAASEAVERTSKAKQLEEEEKKKAEANPFSQEALDELTKSKNVCMFHLILYNSSSCVSAMVSSAPRARMIEIAALPSVLLYVHALSLNYTKLMTRRRRKSEVTADVVLAAVRTESRSAPPPPAAGPAPEGLMP